MSAEDELDELKENPVTPHRLRALFDAVRALSEETCALGLPLCKEARRLVLEIEPAFTALAGGEDWRQEDWSPKDEITARILYSLLRGLGRDLEQEILNHHAEKR